MSIYLNIVDSSVVWNDIQNLVLVIVKFEIPDVNNVLYKQWCLKYVM